MNSTLWNPRSRHRTLVHMLLLVIIVFLSACSSLSSPEVESVSSVTSSATSTVPSDISADPDAKKGESVQEPLSRGPDIEQIKQDLVGRSVEQIQISSIDQILEVDLEDGSQVEQAGVTMFRSPAVLVVVNPQTQARYRANILLSYSHQSGQWILQSLATSNLALLPELVPSPPQTPVALGQPARVGAFTVLVHGIQWVDWRELVPGESFSYQQTQRLLVDVSLRNDTQRMLAWPANATFTVLAEDGMALNAEYGDIQTSSGEGAVGLLPAELQTDECSKRVMDLLYPVSYLKQLLPGEVTRRWLSYRKTPGVERDNLQLEVDLPGPYGDEQQYRSRFLLHGTSSLSPLPWQTPTPQPVVEGQFGELVIKDAQIGPVEEIQDDIHRNLMPCTSQRTVAFQAQNTSAESLVLTTNIWLVDAEGRVYEPLPVNGQYRLEPRQTQTISLAFPALLGVLNQPAAILLGESSTSMLMSPAPSPRVLVQLMEQ